MLPQLTIRTIFPRAIAVGQGAQRTPLNVASSFIDGSHVCHSRTVQLITNSSPSPSLFQLYGVSKEQANSLRDGALMRLVSNARGSYPPTVAEVGSCL